MCPAGARPPNRSGRCWRRWPTPPLTGPRLRLRAEVRRHPRARRSRARHDAARQCASGRGSATRRRPSSRRSSGRSKRRRRTLRAPLLLDGEIVALDDEGRPAGFQRLQGRIHLTERARRRARRSRAAGGAHRCSICSATATRTCAGCRSTERRARLEARFGTADVRHASA